MNKYSSNKIILLAGHTGYIGKLVLTKLIDLGYQVICVGRNPDNKNKTYLTRFNFYKTDICSKTELNKLKGEISKIDAVISCIGSRTGGKQDSWDVEFEANKNLLDLGYDLSCSHFILLSAICVQKPKLEFQFAKIAFENLLISSGMTYSIIRPTAYFKSLSGQIKNIKDGKSFVLFDSGLNTRCKPISENDLSDFICDCLVLDSRLNKILPIGGRGPAFTPQDQAEIIFKLVNKKPKYKKIPSFIFKIFCYLITPLAFISKKFLDLKEFLKIAHYYATESMLLWDEDKEIYSSENTPEYGQESLENYYIHIIKSGDEEKDLGSHKLF